MRNIILCGFMGCGKSTVGRKLAEILGRQFVDMDEYIVEKANMPISGIFSEYGEDHFRMLEREACSDLAGMQGLVIAAGGGALTFSENAAVLSETGDIVLLDVPLAVILKRLEGDTSRPLLARPDRGEAARELYERRLPLYRKAAGLVVDADGDADMVAKAVMEQLNIK